MSAPIPATLRDKLKGHKAVVFGMGTRGQIVCIKPPRDAEECGLYIHIDDIEKYLLAIDQKVVLKEPQHANRTS